MTEELKKRYLKIKRALFEKADSDLNPEQRAAVYTTEGPLLVFAGAGSGKTTVLVRRAAQIIRYGGGYCSEEVPFDLTGDTVAALEAALELSPAEIRPLLDTFADRPCPPYNVLAITFTNKAANEIKTRLSSGICGAADAGEIWAGTFHAICMRILRSRFGPAGAGSQLTIYDADDSKKLISDVMKELNVDDAALSPKYVAAAISRAKERLVGPEEFPARGPQEKKVAQVYAGYQERLREANALDFDDIIMKTVELLNSDGEALSYYSNKFKYILVDEYQDTNPAQFSLVELLSRGHGNIMAVGDDDQSIYRFRGATVENILTFEKAFPGSKVIKLERNYRSTDSILGAANAVIRRNRNRADKALWTERKGGTPVRIERLPDGEAEARRIVELIQSGVASGKRSYRDYAVLYRVNAQSNSIERIFAKSALPYRVYGGQRFADRKEIRDIVAYLQLIVNRSDRGRLLRIVNEPKRQIGKSTMDAVLKIADETGRSAFDVMKHAGDYTALSRSAARLTEFTSVIDRLGEILDSGCPLDAFIRQVSEMTGYRQMLIEAGESEKDRLDNLDEFVSNAVEYMERTDEPTLPGFLEENALVADVDKYDEEADAAVLMTVHSAKGLEFPVVILCGMEDGLFPSLRMDAGDDEIEEERRLCYVALTRARDELYIFHAAQRTIYGKTEYCRPSRFLDDIPDGICVRSDGSYSYQRRDPSRFGETGRGSARPERTGSFGDFGDFFGSAPARPAREGEKLTIGKRTSSPAPQTDSFAPGDRVAHAAFGEGTVISAARIGSDVLYEVIFDTVGTKKLMGRYARMKKSGQT
ncbi:MAG: UvrD-helicase domain-containing protein [Clostridia bacterium]|nr:UvrD-helicase domain-containing protein [Clostridia bacterium]